MRAEPIDILHVIPTYDVGGVERYLLDRLPRLRALGLRVGVCGLRGGALLDDYRAAGVPAYVCGMHGVVDAPRGLVRFAQHLRVLRPRLVHSHLFWSDLAVACTHGAAPRARWISTKHDEARWMSAPSRLLERWMLARVDAVIADSHGVARARAERTPGGPAPRVIYLSAHDPGEIPPAERAAARARFGLSDAALAVGAVARFHRVKGLDVLLDAWRIVEDAVPDAHLVLAGDGPEADALRAQARSLARVHFLGMRRDVENVYRALDVLALSSRSEGFPIAIVEAMSYALPVVATRVGGVDEAVEHDRTGVLVTPESPTALAHALCAVLADASQRALLARNARTAYLARFTPEQEIAALRAVYDEVLA